MQKASVMTFFRYLFYIIEILLIHVFSSTPDLLPEIFGGKPTFLIVVALSVAVFERELPAMIFGLVCGLLIDFGYSSAPGTFTIGLTVICFILGYAANNIIVSNVWNTLLCSLMVILILYSLHFLFTYYLKNYGDSTAYLINHYISRVVLTFVFVPAFYYLHKFIHSTLSADG